MESRKSIQAFLVIVSLQILLTLVISQYIDDQKLEQKQIDRKQKERRLYLPSGTGHSSLLSWHYVSGL
jgi:hypothetical protein